MQFNKITNGSETLIQIVVPTPAPKSPEDMLKQLQAELAGINASLANAVKGKQADIDALIALCPELKS